MSASTPRAPHFGTRTQTVSCLIVICTLHARRVYGDATETVLYIGATRRQSVLSLESAAYSLTQLQDAFSNVTLLLCSVLLVLIFFWLSKLGIILSMQSTVCFV